MNQPGRYALIVLNPVKKVNGAPIAVTRQDEATGNPGVGPGAGSGSAAPSPTITVT